MYLICNHKNNLTYNEIRTLKDSLKTLDIKNVKLILSPSFVYLYSFIRYPLMSQDISIYDDNKTGEISGRQLKSLFVEYILIGHVERRINFNENINVLIKKIKNAHKNNIKVVYCFTSYDTNIESSINIITEEYEQIKEYLNSDDLIAFEPEWAIGNIEYLDLNYIEKIINYISNLVNKKVIYGGSVNENTADNLLKINNIDGFLVSTISNDVDKLQKVINKMT